MRALQDTAASAAAKGGRPSGEGRSGRVLEAARIAVNAWHALIGIVFLLTLALAAGDARADDGPRDEMACGGRDLRPTLAAESPGALDMIRRAGADMPNGDARLWRITSPKGAVSHLYGTVHLSDPDITRLSADAQSAFDTARTVVIETTDIRSPEKTSAALLGRPELMAFTDGGSLLDHMDEEGARILDRALRERGMTLAAVKSLKPWVISGSIALPACESGAARANFLDIRLAREAQEAGREVAGLESASEQFEAVAALPMRFHVDSLIGTAILGSAMDDVFATMGAIYAEGRIGEIPAFLTVASEHFRDRFPEAPESVLSVDPEAMQAFNDEVITKRNRVMAERATPMIEKGGAFIAVGALHLPGEEGLVALLRERGYTVERIAP